MKVFPEQLTSGLRLEVWPRAPDIPDLDACLSFLLNPEWWRLSMELSAAQTPSPLIL